MRKLVTAVCAMCLLAIDVRVSSAEEVFFIEQCRVLDTREIGGPIPNGTELKVNVRQSWLQPQGGTTGCGVPTAAQGVILNVTVAGSPGAGHLEAYPWDMRPPLPHSRINWTLAQVAANQMHVALHPLPLPGTPGTSSWDLVFRPAVSPVHIIADIVGYTKDAFPSFPFGVMQGVVVDKFQDHGTTHLLVEPPGGDCTPFHHDTCYMVECAPYEFANEVCLVASVGECVEIEGFHRPNAGDDHWVGRLVRTVGNPPCPWTMEMPAATTFVKGTIIDKEGGPAPVAIEFDLDTTYPGFRVICQEPWLDPEICELAQYSIGNKLCGTGHISPAFSANDLYLHTITDCQ